MDFFFRLSRLAALHKHLMSHGSSPQCWLERRHDGAAYEQRDEQEDREPEPDGDTLGGGAYRPFRARSQSARWIDGFHMAADHWGRFQRLP